MITVHDTWPTWNFFLGTVQSNTARVCSGRPLCTKCATSRVSILSKVCRCLTFVYWRWKYTRCSFMRSCWESFRVVWWCTRHDAHRAHLDHTVTIFVVVLVQYAARVTSGRNEDWTHHLGGIGRQRTPALQWARTLPFRWSGARWMGRSIHLRSTSTNT